MSKSNEHKKDFREDKFARAYYCQHARLNLVRGDKKQAKKKARQENKRLPSEEIYDNIGEEIENNS